MFSRASIFKALVALFVAPTALGHARWKCPPARDAIDDSGHHIRFSNTGNKVGSCGPYSGMYGMNGLTTLEPGWQTLVWEESIAHAGSPFRIAILDAEENLRAVLLDHIPHWDSSKPTAYVERTYVPYKMSVNIPDIKCDKCILQLIFFMTDKTTKCDIEICQYYPEDSACSGHTDPADGTCFGAPNDVPCVKPNTCYSNYHSCSDVIITGSQPFKTLAKLAQPDDWPFNSLPEGMYGSEEAVWKDGWLVGIPSNYTTPAGNLKC